MTSTGDLKCDAALPCDRCFKETAGLSCSEEGMQGT